uniref:Uncharacterized protein n=1 Tax=Solanum tuberosum TaxID=4113 RepID=M1BS65_SOLTU
MNTAKDYPGESLFSSVVDKVIEIIETCRVCSTLLQRKPTLTRIRTTAMQFAPNCRIKGKP